MYPWAEGTPDDNLLHHFEGESVEGHTSNFVSTTSSLRMAVEHAASLARPNSEEPFDAEFVTYIYQIRPGRHFYDVEASLAHARDRVPAGTQERNRLDAIFRDYGGMEELVARGGFSHDRIIAYARLDAQMLTQFGLASNSPLFTASFWSHRWTANTDYDPAFNTDTSSPAVYTHIGGPQGYRQMVGNGTQPAVPIAFTCEGVRFDGGESTHRERRETHRAAWACARYRGMTRPERPLDPITASRSRLILISTRVYSKVFYDPVRQAIVHDEL